MNLVEKIEALAFTFDDVLLAPGYSEVLPTDVELRTRLAADLYLNVPILSAAMDTVSEARMGIGLARLGGIGVLHRNLSPEAQAEEVDKVKRSEAGMVVDPVTLHPENTLADAEAIMSRYHISGVPIVDKQGVWVGILTNRDTRFVKPGKQIVSDFMTHENLVTANVGTTLEEAMDILHTHRIEKLPLVDENGRLKGLSTFKDIEKKVHFPQAAKDANGRLLCAAAIGVGDKGLARLDKLVAADVDVAVIDTAHGHTALVLHTVHEAKKRCPHIAIIAGNAATADGVRDLAQAGADAVKVGIGAGSICTTRIVAGVEIPQLTAVLDCATEAQKHNIPCIADGGIKYSGDIVKALAAGGNAVMLGSMLVGLEESLGDIILYEGRRYKVYRGMGSLGAMQGHGADQYGSGVKTNGKRDKLVPEGVEGQLPYRGKLADIVYQLMDGLRSGMGYVGAKDLAQLQEKSRFVRITNAGLLESRPHGILITQEAPNYQARR